MIALLNKISSHRVRVDVVEGKLKLYSEKSTINADLIAEIKANKEALINYILETKETPETTQKNDQIPTIALAEDYAVSSAQKRLWILSQFHESSILYNMPFAIDIPFIEHDIIEKALYDLLERHEILRTIFISNEQGEVRQKIIGFNEIEVAVHYEDVSGNENGADEANNWIAKDKRKAFHLEEFPLFRVAVFKVLENQCILYFNIHHIICDGWSLDILQKEFLDFCKYHISGKKHNLTPLTIQYKEYASYQNTIVNSEDFSIHKNYWLQKLTQPLPTLTIATEKVRPVLKTAEGRHLQSTLAPEKFAKLKQFVTENNGSIFSGLLSIWYLLLHKYSHQKELIIGTPVAGRDHWSLMDQIGFYVNMLPLKITVDATESYIEFYNRLKNSINNDFEHQAYPFDTLVNDLQIVRDHSRNAVFDVMMTHVQHQGKATGFAKNLGKTYEIVEDFGACFAKFDMEIECVNTVNSIAINFKYNEAVYTNEFMKQFVSHYHQLLSEILENPKNTIAKYSCLTEAGQQELINYSRRQLNKTETQHTETFLTLFETQVSRTPNATAIVFGDQEISYRELANRSNQFAAFLQEKHHIQATDFVGVQLTRNESLIIAILGILKTGAVYIPIPQNKQEQEKIQQDCSYKLLITDAIVAQFNSEANTHTTDFKQEVNKDQLAYIIYTSGTTGMPKGVMISHENVYAFVKNLGVNFGMQNVTNFAATTKVTFDISILEILGTLALGKKMVLFSDAQLENPELFLQGIETHKIEGLQLTPSRLKQLQHLGEFAPKHLQLLLVGGEAIDSSLYKKLQEKNYTVYNVYGPTETTIWSSCVEISKNNQIESIGTPLKDESIYILDSNLKMVPKGVVGDIYIGGSGVAKGYLHREELTQQRFVVNPYDSQERIYKTGDLGKWHHSGVIQFMGRSDNQIKIRGHRIELNEIKTALKNYGLLDEVAVIVQENAHDEHQIIAFFTASTTIQISELIAYAKSVLQNYKVPSHFVQLPEFKLNNSGKIDTVALKNYTVTTVVDAATYEKPSTDSENLIATVWAEILKIPSSNVSANDNFYNLGGDSVSSIKVLARLQQMGYAIEMKDILLNPILKTLAQRLDKNLIATNKIEPIQLEWAVFSNYHFIDENTPNYIIIHDGNGELFGYRLLLEKLQKTHNIWGFVLEKATLEPSVITPTQMSKAYAEVLQKTFKENDTISLVGWSFGGYIAYQIADILENTKCHITIKEIFMVDTMDYVDSNYDEFYQEAFFEKDHTLSLTKEKEMVKAICPQINIDDIQESSMVSFWGKISEIISENVFDFYIPDYWRAHFEKLYPKLDTYTAFQKMNQLRTIGLHIPVPCKNVVTKTAITYIKAKESDSSHQEYWQQLATNCIKTVEISGTHGTLMQQPHVDELFNVMKKEKEEQQNKYAGVRL